MGKLFLASLDADQLDAVLSRTDLTPFTSYTVVQRERLLRQLEQIRQRIGPLVHAVGTPFESWRLTLARHEAVPVAIAADMTATHPPQLWPRIEYFENGQMYHAQTEIVQLFQVTSGWVEAGGRRWDLGGWRCVRDHCWGSRPLSRVTPVHTWVPAFFDDRQVLLWHTVDAEGSPMHSFAQMFLPDGSILDTADTQITYMDERQTHFEWAFRTADGVEHRLTGDKAGKHGVMHQAGWSGERDTDHYGSARARDRGHRHVGVAHRAQRRVHSLDGRCPVCDGSRTHRCTGQTR